MAGKSAKETIDIIVNAGESCEAMTVNLLCAVLEMLEQVIKAVEKNTDAVKGY